MSRIQSRINSARLSRDRVRRNRPVRNLSPVFVADLSAGETGFDFDVDETVPGVFEVHVVYSGSETGAVFSSGGLVLSLSSTLISFTDGTTTISASVARLPRGRLFSLGASWYPPDSGELSIWVDGVVIAEGRA